MGLEYSIRIIESNDWATYLLDLCFLLIALANYFYPRRLDDFMMLPMNNKYFTVHGKEDNLQHPFNIFLFAGSLIFIYIFPGQYKAMLVFVLAILALNVITLLYSYKKNGILIASNFLYFILYLCALEISPYIILYRLIITDTSI